MIFILYYQIRTKRYKEKIKRKMKTATSIVKLPYKMAKSGWKYVYPSLPDPVTELPEEIVDDFELPLTNMANKLSWSSFLVLYKHPKLGLLVDKAYIFLGDIPEHFHSYFINFINWGITSDKDATDHNVLLYNNTEIDPMNVHLHIHVGDSPYDTEHFLAHPTYYRHYFSDPKNKIYKAISGSFKASRVFVCNTGDYPPLSNKSLHERAEKFIDPRFFNFRRQVYGKNMDHVMFTGLNYKVL